MDQFIFYYIQALSLKNESHVKDENKIRRLEEDRNILKKKLERFDRSALIGSTDAVLMEEIKELKVSLIFISS